MNLPKTVAVLGLLAAGLSAQQPVPTGTFTATGDMITARYGHTATLLADGRVLIAGGRGVDNGNLSSAEIYNPSSGTFRTTGSMTVPRYLAAATLLQDGRVFIAGNIGTGGGAEIYDPSTGTFSSAVNLPATYHPGTATVLNNGKVLVLIPVLINDPTTLGGAALYDPSTGTLTPTGNPPLPGPVQTATLLPDGRVFFDGGTDLQGTFNSGQLYDPVTDRFTRVIGNGSTAGYGYWDTATLLLNGNVLVAGGGNGDDGIAFASAALYDRASGALTPTGNMTTPRYAHRATRLPDGTVLITGGDGGCCAQWIAGGELYDPSAGVFRSAGNMTTARALHTATLLTDGTVLITGGAGSGGRTTASAELYHPSTPAQAPKINSGGIVDAASFGSKGYVPAAGSIASLFGTGLATSTLAATTLPLPATLGGTTVTIDGRPMPLFYVSPTQINFQVPWEICCPDEDTRITVIVNGVFSNTYLFNVPAFGPALFSADSTGRGQGAIQISNTSIFAAPAGSIPGAQSRPARRGESITIYCLGLGWAVTNRPASGKPASADPLSTTLFTPTVAIGGSSARVTFSGLAPGLVGVYQVNVEVPDGAPTGDAVPVSLSIYGIPSSNVVTMAVQ